MGCEEIESYFARFSKEWADICTFLKQFQGLDRIQSVSIRTAYRKQQERNEKGVRIRGRAILMLDGKRNPIMQFTNAIDAAEFVGGKPNSIRCKCGTQYTYKGYFWEWVDMKEVSDIDED